MVSLNSFYYLGSKIGIAFAVLTASKTATRCFISVREETRLCLGYEHKIKQRIIECNFRQSELFDDN